MTRNEMISLAQDKAHQYGLDTALVCALVEQESSWNPWSIRYEPDFFAHYIQPLMDKQPLGATEATARATSWGLMQTMGEVAREYGFRGEFLSELCDPETGLDVGCKYLSALIGKEKDINAALLRWNGGGNPKYPDQVKARIPTYSV